MERQQGPKCLGRRRRKKKWKQKRKKRREEKGELKVEIKSKKPKGLIDEKKNAMTPMAW